MRTQGAFSEQETPAAKGAAAMTHPTFPGTANLPDVEPTRAMEALFALRQLERDGTVDVYASAGSNDMRWNVWDNVARARIPLAEWVSSWLANNTSNTRDV
jgi:hypothetical protein